MRVCLNILCTSKSICFNLCHGIDEDNKIRGRQRLRMVKTRRTGKVETASSNSSTTENPTPRRNARRTVETRDNYVKRLQPHLVSSPESDADSQSALASLEGDSKRDDTANLAGIGSCSESDGAVTTPKRRNVDSKVGSFPSLFLMSIFPYNR